MGLAQCSQMLAYLAIWTSNFLFGINDIDGKFPVFGSFFGMLLFFWILEGIGYIIRIVFGWNMEEVAARSDNRVNPAPSYLSKRK